MFGGWHGLRNLICDVKECKNELSKITKIFPINDEDLKLSIHEGKSRTTHLYSSTVASHQVLNTGSLLESGNQGVVS